MASGNPNTEDQTGAKSPTGLLPFNAFGGKTPEVGDVCSFRVVQIYDDQVEVEYVRHGKDEDHETDYGVGPEPQEQMTDYMS